MLSWIVAGETRIVAVAVVKIDLLEKWVNIVIAKIVFENSFIGIHRLILVLPHFER